MHLGLQWEQRINTYGRSAVKKNQSNFFERSEKIIIEMEHRAMQHSFDIKDIVLLMEEERDDKQFSLHRSAQLPTRSRVRSP